MGNHYAFLGYGKYSGFDRSVPHQAQQSVHLDCAEIEGADVVAEDWGLTFAWNPVPWVAKLLRLVSEGQQGSGWTSI